MNKRRSHLEESQFYHIYNRGVNKQEIFFEKENYTYFLKKYKQFISPFVETYAYCLLNNHFHFLIRVKTEKEIRAILETKHIDKTLSWVISNVFASFFRSCTLAVNKKYQRTGPLLEESFKRIEVETETYLTQLIAYINSNAQKHNLVEDFRDYPYSSYKILESDKPTMLMREEVLNWFGGREPCLSFHRDFKKYMDQVKSLTFE